MTIDEASEKYNIPIHILQEYEQWGLCGEVRKVMGDWQYDDSDIEKLSMILTLHDIGFVNSDIEVYMRLLQEGSKTEKKRMQMLNGQRSSTLKEIHLHEQQLERIDYLRYKMRKGK